MRGSFAVPVFFRSLGEQFLSELFQLLLHHPVIHKVHRLELIDEPDQAIPGFLMPPVSLELMEWSMSWRSWAVCSLNDAAQELSGSLTASLVQRQLLP